MDTSANLRLQGFYKMLKREVQLPKSYTIHGIYNIIRTAYDQIDIIDEMLQLGDDFIKEQMQTLRNMWIEIAEKSEEFLIDINSYKVDDIVIKTLNMTAREFLPNSLGRDLVQLSNLIKKNNNCIDYRIVKESGIDKYYIISLFQFVKYDLISEGKRHSIEFEYIIQIIDCLEEYWIVN